MYCWKLNYLYIDLENQRKYVTLFVIVVIWLAKKGSCLAREPASQLTSSRAELRAKILRANFEPSLLRAKDFRASSEPSFSELFFSYTNEPSRTEPSLARSHPYLRNIIFEHKYKPLCTLRDNRFPSETCFVIDYAGWPWSFYNPSEAIVYLVISGRSTPFPRMFESSCFPKPRK